MFLQPRGFSYAAWLMPDPSDDSTVPRFLGILHTGLTYKAIEQIERAQQAVTLLEQGMSLL